jgi:hypothetical protein
MEIEAETQGKIVYAKGMSRMLGLRAWHRSQSNHRKMYDGRPVEKKRALGLAFTRLSACANEAAPCPAWRRQIAIA